MRKNSDVSSPLKLSFMSLMKINFEIILDELKNHLINEIKWVILGCDGPRYNLVSQIIENTESKYEWVTLTSG